MKPRLVERAEVDAVLRPRARPRGGSRSPGRSARGFGAARLGARRRRPPPSSSAATTAIVLPSSTSVSAGTSWTSVPSPGASISTDAFDVSTTQTTVPLRTAAPSSTSHSDEERGLAVRVLAREHDLEHQTSTPARPPRRCRPPRAAPPPRACGPTGRCRRGRRRAGRARGAPPTPPPARARRSRRRRRR